MEEQGLREKEGRLWTMVVCTKQLLTVCTRSRQCSSSVVLSCVVLDHFELCCVRALLLLVGNHSLTHQRKSSPLLRIQLSRIKVLHCFGGRKPSWTFFVPDLDFRRYSGNTAVGLPLHSGVLASFPLGLSLMTVRPSGEENLSRGPFAQLSWVVSCRCGVAVAFWNKSSGKRD